MRQLSSRLFVNSKHLLVIILFYLTAFPSLSFAEDNDRYRAVVMHEGGRSGQTGNFFPKVFILDSKEGHMWTWEEKTKIKNSKGGLALGTVITYQGQVKPAKQMGDIVDQSSNR